MEVLKRTTMLVPMRRKKRTTKLVRITNYPQTLKRMKKVLLHFDISLFIAYLSHFPFDTEQKSSMAVWGPKFDI